MTMWPLGISAHAYMMATYSDSKFSWLVQFDLSWCNYANMVADGGHLSTLVPGLVHLVLGSVVDTHGENSGVSQYLWCCWYKFDLREDRIQRC